MLAAYFLTLFKRIRFNKKTMSTLPIILLIFILLITPLLNETRSKSEGIILSSENDFVYQSKIKNFIDSLDVNKMIARTERS